MAITAGSCNYGQTLGASYETCFDPSLHGRCATFRVSCPSSSSESVIAFVGNVHKAGDAGDEIVPGKDQYYKEASYGIGVVQLKSKSATAATAGWSVTDSSPGTP